MGEGGGGRVRNEWGGSFECDAEGRVASPIFVEKTSRNGPSFPVETSRNHRPRPSGLTSLFMHWHAPANLFLSPNFKTNPLLRCSWKPRMKNTLLLVDRGWTLRLVEKEPGQIRCTAVEATAMKKLETLGAPAGEEVEGR